MKWCNPFVTTMIMVATGSSQSKASAREPSLPRPV